MVELLGVLKDFADFGGTFIALMVVLALVLKKFDSIEDKLVKILTLLSVSVHATTSFNGVEHVLNSDADAVAKILVESQTKEDKPE